MSKSLIVQLLAVLCCSTAHAVAVYDLQGDWSEVDNPNGVWSYNEGANPLPSIASWGAGVGAAWARAPEGNLPPSNDIPVWFQSAGTEAFANDLMAGDIVVHTQDESNGVGNGPANVTWTSPVDGSIDISGSVWMGRDIGRGNSWELLVNGASLTGGAISSGDAFDRDQPFSFDLGSAGANALTGIGVSEGDVVSLQLVRTTSFGDFVGVNMTVVQVPEPSVGSLLLAGAFGFLYVRHRRALDRGHVAAA